MSPDDALPSFVKISQRVSVSEWTRFVMIDRQTNRQPWEKQYMGRHNNKNRKNQCLEYDLLTLAIYSRLSLSRLRLSRITAYLEEKI